MLEYCKESFLERSVISGLANHPPKTCLRASKCCTVTAVRLSHCSSKTYPAAGLLTLCTALQSVVTSRPARVSFSQSLPSLAAARLAAESHKAQPKTCRCFSGHLPAWLSFGVFVEQGSNLERAICGC